ncbi:[Pyruvate dehydrogenase (acetyl-transferring)] kinase 2, mitochondrial [Tieghemiomyces parasiticus]|uniref:Protein-serine/threonine kinase n=1 Tax=Tieghemiomyces parasiticus TaxID=78921 RepID=A0A9W7ZH99_9FUNG|nr:[Pyruvate dehydrogenase (acetyl-transferring)] kinase 2, mitochondrial [Tieghemiomyces parasiticus]
MVPSRPALVCAWSFAHHHHGPPTVAAVHVHRRWTHPQFYRNHNLDPYLVQPSRKITLRQLVVFGRHVTEERLLLSANYVRTELPIRLARRIRDFQHLPFIVGANPYLAEVYDLYWQAFEDFRRFPEIKTLEDNHRFVEGLRARLRDHLVVIPKLAIGINECAEHMTRRTTNHFMNVVLRSRISRRVLAEQHIALTQHYELVNGLGGRWPTADEDENLEGFQGEYDAECATTLSPQSSSAVGIVHTNCSALDIVERCSARCRSAFRQAYDTRITPSILVGGSLGAQFTYIPDHIEYVIYELLKNAMRTVMDSHAHVVPASTAGATEGNGSRATTGPNPYPPIQVTLCEGPATLVFRISDQGGGVPATAREHIWDFGHGKRGELANLYQVSRMAAKLNDPMQSTSPLTHFGIGLPMSRVYVNYWGGRIEIHTMDGFGTDVYVHIPKLGNQHEHIETADVPADQQQASISTTAGQAAEPSATPALVWPSTPYVAPKIPTVKASTKVDNRVRRTMEA